ncbi:MAG: hypothetical protein U0470_10925 [Anaerolineae bacterium]
MADSERTARGPVEVGRDVASFVLRFTQDLYEDEAGESRVRWRGHIRHVQSDADARFTEFADAVAFIQRRLAELTKNAVADRSPADQEQVMADSLQFWERFASGYATMVLDAFSQTMAKSEAVRQQVGEQIERSLTWWTPFLGPTAGGPKPPPTAPDAPDAAAVLAALGEVAARLRALDEKVTRVEAALRARGEAEGGGKGKGRGARSA